MNLAPSGTPVLRTLAVAASVLIGALSLQSAAQDATTSAQGRRVTIEDEVVNNICNQPAGLTKIGEYRMAPAFLLRVGDRIIRSTYRSRYHGIAGSPSGVAPVGSEPADGWGDPAAGRKQSIAGWTVHLAPKESVELKAYRDALPTEFPALRGYRIADDDAPAAEWWPTGADQRGALEADVRRLVARELTSHGLLPTTARAIEALGVDSFDGGDEDRIRLRRVGLPTDWFAAFGSGDPAREIAAIVSQLATGVSAESLRGELKGATFRFRPTLKGFHAALEDGSESLAMLRLQLTRGDYWGGAEDGGSVHIARQLLGALPKTDFRIHIESRFLKVFSVVAKEWPIGDRERVELLLEPRTIAQWAQDNGKAGTFVADGKRHAATLVPRFASRREDGSQLVPGECFVASTLAASGHRVARSPLLFQGGDLLVARAPEMGLRWLFVGEAEIERNRTLGLTRLQVISAFRIEFGVDRVIVLPSISFHIDYDVCFRYIDGRLIAFVDDEAAAERLMLQSAIPALVRAGFPEAEAKAARKLLDGGQALDAIARLAPFIYSHRDTQGMFPFSFAARIATGSETSTSLAASGEFTRLLTAIDGYAASAMSEASLGDQTHRVAHVRSLRRKDALRQALITQLTDLGIRVVPIPSLSEAEQSIDYINGIHARGIYLMPVYGGFFEPLDRAAMAAFERALGDDVRIVPVLCSESQRRNGAVHCSAVAYPLSDSP